MLRKLIECRFYFQPSARSSLSARLIWADEWFTSTVSALRGCRKRNGASSLQRAAPTCHRNRRPRFLKALLGGKPLRHPIHPMLVHFPIGFLVLSFLLDLVSLAFPGVPNLVRCSFYAMLPGVVAAVLAAVPGFVHYSEIRRGHPGKAIAYVHLT